MSYRLIPPEMLVAEYEPTTLRVACERCKRDAHELKVQALRKWVQPYLPTASIEGRALW